MKISKTLALAGLLSLALAGSAFASSCPKHMAAIDAAMAKTPKLSAQQLNEVKSQRAKGEELHKAGKHAESVQELEKAEKTLGVK